MSVKRKTILNIAEAAIIVCITAFVIVTLTSGSSRHVPISEIKEFMMSLEGTEGLFEKDARGTDSSFKMVPSEYIYLKPNEIMDVRELFIVYEKDDAAMEKVEKAIETRLNEQIDNFTGYGTTQLGILEKAVIMKKGDYCFFAVGNDADVWQARFSRLVG